MKTVHTPTTPNHSSPDPSALSQGQHLNQELLGWKEINEIFPDLTTDPCQRFELLLDLYLDERCTSQVFHKLEQHENTCDTCSMLKENMSVFSQTFVTCLEDIESTVTAEDAEESLRHILEHRWDEFSLGDLGLDELREEMSRSSHSTSGSMRLEYDPPLPTQRSKRRLISGLCTIAAAAVLFAYGPNLIESNIGDREPQFPTLSQDVKVQNSTSHTPLAEREGETLTRFDSSSQLTLNKLILEPMSDRSSAHITYQVSLDSSTAVDEVKVDLWRKQINSQQQLGLRAKFSRASQHSEIHLLSESGMPVQVRFYQVPNSDLSIVEYLIKDQHYQWSAQLPIDGDQILMTLVRSHLQELAQ